MGNGHDLSATYFSLSRRMGQMAGKILLAQSSSVKKSIVAHRASNPATRAWAKGSRRDRVKAAIRTLARVYIILVELKMSPARDLRSVPSSSRFGQDRSSYLCGYQVAHH